MIQHIWRSDLDREFMNWMRSEAGLTMRVVFQEYTKVGLCDDIRRFPVTAA